MDQRIISPDDDYRAVDEWIRESGIKRLMLVCGSSIGYQKELNGYLEELEDRTGTAVIRFSDFRPNPDYEDVLKGVSRFREKECDGMMAVGGGSAMDTAKCIKLFTTMEGSGENGAFLGTDGEGNDIPFLAVPTTAGSGSEATRFAVIYHKGKKQSITHECILPGTVLFDPSGLVSLPLYQKKSTMADALSHAMEAFWSVNSTEESREYSKQAIRLILENTESYLAGGSEGHEKMLLAANIAGRAINIARTTAGHAMCYKITGLFSIPHGHAAILCNRILYPWMIQNTDKCIDPRGEAYIRNTFDELGKVLGGDDAQSGADMLSKTVEKLGLSVPAASVEQLKELKISVNPERLKNNPIQLDAEDIEGLYRKILVTE